MSRSKPKPKKVPKKPKGKKGGRRKKGDKSLKQARMKLLSKPTCPEWLPIVKIKLNQERMPSAWREYLVWAGLIEEGK